MYKYAQVNAGQVICLSELHSVVENPALIALDENGQHQGRVVKLGDVFDGTSFADGEQAE